MLQPGRSSREKYRELRRGLTPADAEALRHRDQLCLVDNQQMIQALAADGPDEALRESVRPRHVARQVARVAGHTGLDPATVTGEVADALSRGLDAKSDSLGATGAA
jgi:hypothetical protein